MLRKDMHEDNRRSWNAATEAHNSHKVDQAAFFRAGGSTLYPDEIELLGDLKDKTLIHLQCNSGQDTLSIARLGATVTGVDISDSAITFAQQLSIDTGIAGQFIRSDVYDWFEQASQRGEKYDIVFSSYGAIIWLSDIAAWAKGVDSVLKAGGKVVVLDFHPYPMILVGTGNQSSPTLMGRKASTLRTAWVIMWRCRVRHLRLRVMLKA